MRCGVAFRKHIKNQIRGCLQQAGGPIAGLDIFVAA